MRKSCELNDKIYDWMIGDMEKDTYSALREEILILIFINLRFF